MTDGMLTITLEAEGIIVTKTRVVRDPRTLDIVAATLAVEAKESLSRQLHERSQTSNGSQ